MTEQEKEELAHYAGYGIQEFGDLNDLDPGVRSLLINTYDLNIMPCANASRIWKL